MTYYNEQQIEWDTQDAKAIYWESKDLGYSTPERVKPVYVRDTQCSKCKRWGSAKAVASHNANYPDCDK